jgi:ABC-2 type transport system ATP-binding protein
MEYVLSTEQLCKSFGKKKAVDHVSLHVRRGDIYGLIGRNGAGKTTFLKMVAGLMHQNSGSIALFGCTGEEIVRRDLFERVGTLIEAPGLHTSMTAHENMQMKCILAGKKDTDAYISDLLALVGLADVGKKKVGKYSLGMKQRLGIAMALVGEPEFLVLDEPINGLDPQGIAEVREIIRRLHNERSITILISSHILEELSKIATNYGIIENGKLCAELTRAELEEQCSSRIVIHMDEPQQVCPVFQSMGIEQYRLTDENTVCVYERLSESPDIILALSAAGVRIRTLSIEGQAIEDFFFSVVGGANHV